MGWAGGGKKMKKINAGGRSMELAEVQSNWKRGMKL